MQHYTDVEDLSEKIVSCVYDICFNDSRTIIDDCASCFSVYQFCDNCKEKQSATKQLSISKPPPVLILHLKRFDFFRQTKVCFPSIFVFR
jgi:ubiquitin C-terminal hydrolase